MRLELLITISILSVVTAFPGKLLRVPKIYNALITTKEKLLPSEAYPATTGPIFQPIAFTGEPVLLNANEFIDSANRQESWRGNVENDENSSESAKKPSPLVFYPRYGVYYPHHTVVSYVNTLQHSFVYTAVDRSKGGVKVPLARPEIERNVNVDDYSDETSYATNRRPIKVEIPDVPPPPLPVSYLSNDQGKKKDYSSVILSPAPGHYYVRISQGSFLQFFSCWRHP